MAYMIIKLDPDIAEYMLVICTDESLASCGREFRNTTGSFTDYPNTTSPRYYRIKACNSKGCSDFSSFDTGYKSGSSSNNMPDLVILSPSVANFSLNPSDSFTFNYSVKNIGDGGSNVSDTRIRFYKSTDSIIDTSDIDIGTNAADSLTPNQVKSFTKTLQAPSNAGTYWIGACVNLTSSESSINNNCSTGVRIDVKEQMADQDVFSENSVLLPSFAEKVQVHVLVNQYYKGGSPSKQDPSIGFYWSKNSSLDVSEDIYLGETKCDLVNRDFLNYYDRYCQVEKSLNLPLSIPEGKQYLFIDCY